MSLDQTTATILQEVYASQFESGERISLDTIADKHQIERSKITRYTQLLINDGHVQNECGGMISITPKGVVHAENNRVVPEGLFEQNLEIRLQILGYLEEAFENNENGLATKEEITDELDIDPFLIHLNLDFHRICDHIEARDSDSLVVTAMGLQYLQNWRKDVAATEDMQKKEETEMPEPLELREALKHLRKDHPDPSKVAFIVMQFKETKLHDQILKSVKDTLGKFGIIGVRADDKEYADDLLANVRTYMHGCGFGVAIFERLSEDDINPNVSLEVGYMMAFPKPVCLLKDQTLGALQTDLAGRLYRAFDPQDPEGTIPSELEKWMSDRSLIL